MSAVGVVSVAFGLIIAISRGLLVVLPAATLRWFAKCIETEARTRLFGVCVLPIPGAMIWAGASEESGLAGVLLIFGVFMLMVIVWPVVFPRSYMEFCGAFVAHDPSSNLMGWRMIGLVGVAFGMAFIHFGRLAL